MIGDIVTFFNYRRDCLLADKEIAYLRALSAFLKETYRQNIRRKNVLLMLKAVGV